ncbi:hypothetical protein QYM36_013665 [Artemia franciscana]|uniref:Reverse transcriptase domain-containing protein n=1 Tax=Artemia franciscana TaxID=6661 RepID=A0AA88L2C2_ARTSF|nr:hypothetical protein QYM36_013665 [Artemia franciscana]
MDGSGLAGVGIMITPKIALGLMDYEAVSDRIVLARLKGHLTILSVYAHIHDIPDHLKDKFYADLQLTLNKIPRKDILVIGGDFNGRIGTRLNDSEWAIINHGLGDRCINGVRLIMFAMLNNLSVANTWFKYKPFRNIRNSRTRPNQAGFRPGMGYCDHIFSLRQIPERHLVHKQETIQVFIDFVTPFFSVKKSAIWDAMRDDGVPGKIVRLIKLYNKGTRVFVRGDGDISRGLSIDEGVGQGCALSPIQFKFVMDQIMKTLNKYKGVAISPILSITDLYYANDVDILAESVLGKDSSLLATLLLDSLLPD